MKTLILNYNEAHSFIENNSHRGYYWDGWNMVRWVPNHSGFMQKNGMYRNGRWGVSYTFPVNESGNWDIKVPANV